MIKKKNFIVPPEEEFTCQHCGEEVAGGRYINHCPHCLWSKHVDKNIPGDRKSSCQGLMKPIGVKHKSGQWRIIHRCIKCGKITTTDSQEEDSQEKIIELSRQPVST